MSRRPASFAVRAEDAQNRMLCSRAAQHPGVDQSVGEAGVHMRGRAAGRGMATREQRGAACHSGPAGTIMQGWGQSSDE